MLEMLTGRDRRRVLFVKRIAGVQTVIGKRNIKSSTERVTFQKRQYPIDTRYPSYRTKKFYMYVLNIETGQLYFQANIENKIDSRLMDMIFNQEIVKQIVSSLTTKPFMESIVMIIMGICMGVALGYILGNFIPFTPPATGG
jgi:hypothetical protein